MRARKGQGICTVVKAKSRAFELGWKELLDAKGIPVGFPLGHVPVTMFDVMRHVQKLNDFKFLGEAEGRIQAREEFFFECRSGLQECMPTWLVAEYDDLVRSMCAQNYHLLKIIQGYARALRMEVVNGAIKRAILGRRGRCD